MAHSTLPVLSSQNFPQVFAAAMDLAVARILAKPELSTCDFEDEFCDCRQPATVHDLATDREFCARHFGKVSRG